MTSPTKYRFDRFTLVPATRSFLEEGRAVGTTGRSFDLLVALVERRREVVSKNELMDLVWPNVVVEESNLHVQIAALRRQIGRAAIATVPGRGYVFTSEVQVEVDGGAVPPPAVVERSSEAGARPDSLDAPGNLPFALPWLAGREQDHRAILALLLDHAVVTVTGPGGIGKTRVAQAVARVAQDRHDGGAWWVELAAVNDAFGVASTVGRVLGIVRSDRRVEVTDLGRGLRGRSLLLVLDNCEHLLDAVLDLVTTMRAEAPDVTMLLTSQQPLGAAEESIYRLGGLALPSSPDLDAVRNASGTALFVARACAADRHFALSAANAPTVRDIVERLDGIPLAIELAAARLPLLGLDGLCARLQERFDVLTASSRGRPPRQQTLKAALEWSHGLLTGGEQALFRRLAVFVGGFTLEAAQAVGAADGVDRWDVLELLGALVDKSLVLVDGGNTPRYRYLETARLFASKALHQAGEADRFRRRHAERMRDHLREAFEDVWTVRQNLTIIPELDNARAAFDWSVGDGNDRAFALELHGYSLALWPRVVLAGEGIARCRAIRSWVDASTPAPIAARFWLAFGYTGHLTSALECLDAARRAADGFRALDDPRRLFDALYATGSIAAQRGDFVLAAQAIAEAERLVESDWPATRLAVLAYLAFEVAYQSERFDDAARLAERQAEFSRRALRPVGEALALGNRGTAEVWTRDLVTIGEARIRDAQARLVESGGAMHAGHMLLALAQSLVRRGDVVDGARQARTAYALLKREDDHVRMKLGLLPLLAARQGRYDLAALALGHAMASDRPVSAETMRLRTQTLTVLRAALPPDRLQVCIAEGRVLDEDDVFERVLGPL